MSSGDDTPTVNEIVEKVVRERMRPADPEDMDYSWELGFHIEGAVFDAVLRGLPDSQGRDLVEQVIALVDWPRVAEKATWRIEEREETIL